MGTSVMEIEDTETKARCCLELHYNYFPYPYPERLQVKMIKQFMKACKEARRDKTSNYRRP